MKHAKKMKLVEIDDVPQPFTDHSYLSLQSDENFKAPRVLSMLDNSMNAILHRGDINDGEKWALYNQTLQKYLYHMKKSHAQNSTAQQFNRSTIQPLNCNQSVVSEPHYQTPEAFINRIPELNISGIFPINPSIAGISEPTVKEFFEKARLSGINRSSISHESLDETSVSLPDLTMQPQEQEEMSIAAITPEKMENVTTRYRAKKRNALRDMTIVHPYKVVAKERQPVPQNIQPTQLYRDRKQPQSNYDFIWNNTNAR